MHNREGYYLRIMPMTEFFVNYSFLLFNFTHVLSRFIFSSALTSRAMFLKSRMICLERTINFQYSCNQAKKKKRNNHEHFTNFRLISVVHVVSMALISCLLLEIPFLQTQYIHTASQVQKKELLQKIIHMNVFSSKPAIIQRIFRI